jgi:hypothetical protein
MSLPQIYNPMSVVIEPVAEKTYPDSYLTRLILSPPNDAGQQSLCIVTRPYNYATKELYPQIGCDRELKIADVFAEAARAPTLAVAMGAVLQVSSLLLEESALNSRIGGLSLPVATTDDGGNPLDEATIAAAESERVARLAVAEARLVEVQTALGIEL